MIIKSLSNPQRWDGAVLPFLLGLILSLSILGYAISHKFEDILREQLTKQLKTTLDLNRATLNHWASMKKRRAEKFAASEDIKSDLIDMLKTSQNFSDDPASTRKFLEQKRLSFQNLFSRISKQSPFDGFVVTNSDGQQLFSYDRSLNVEIESPDFSWLMKNEKIKQTTLLHSVSTKTDQRKEHDPAKLRTFFIVPLTDRNGQFMGSLLLQLDKSKDVASAVNAKEKETDKEASSETLIFNSEGVMLSESVHADLISKLSAFADQKRENLAHHLVIKNPGVNLVQNPKALTKKWADLPLTKMADSALKGSSGLDIRGYNNHLGVPVIGAWVWSDDLNLGLAYEIEMSAAYQPLNQFDSIFYFIFCLLMFMAFLSMIFHWKQMRTKRSQKLTEKALKENEIRTHAIVSQLSDGIFTMDETGEIQSLNRAAEEIVLCSSGQTEKINLQTFISPDSYDPDDETLFDPETKILNPQSLGIAHELTGLRTNQDRFPMELMIDEMSVGNKKLYTGILRDITEKKAALANLEKMTRQRESILLSIAEGVLGLDEKGKIVFANPAAQKILGYSSQELIGSHPEIFTLSLLNSNDQSQRGLFVEGRVTTNPIDEEVFWMRKDNDLFPVEYVCNPLIIQGVSTGAVITFRDITEQKFVQNKLIEAKESAEKASSEKSIFLSKMSHELKTPLNSILGYAQLLERNDMEPLSSRQKEDVIEIRNSGEHLLDKINGILDLARAQDGQLKVHLGRLEVKPLLLQIHKELMSKAKNYDQIFELADIPKALFVEADAKRLKESLHHLVSNALESNPPGGRVMIKTETLYEKKCRISIEDSGLELSEEKIDDLLNPSPSDDEYHAKGADEAGIGLALTKKVVELMQGELGVSNNPDKGRSFYIDMKISDSETR